MSLHDIIGEVIAVVVALVAIGTFWRARTKDAIARAEERGELRKWREGVDARLESRKDEYKELRRQIHDDHKQLSERVDAHFDVNGKALDGIEKRVERLTGILEGKGAI